MILGSVDGHSRWFSSRALREGGVDANYPDPHPGVSFFERDPLTNEPLGTGREKAVGTLKLNSFPAIKRRTGSASLTGFHALRRLASRGFRRLGRCPSEEEAYEIWHSLSESGDLSLRVFASVRETDAADRVAAQFKRFEQSYSSQLIRPEAIKLAADGVPEGHTAFLLTPYVDSTNEDFGQPMISKANLTANVTTYFSQDIPVHIHAIGGAACVCPSMLLRVPEPRRETTQCAPPLRSWILYTLTIFRDSKR